MTVTVLAATPVRYWSRERKAGLGLAVAGAVAADRKSVV